ncbi:alkaline phosphatase family protein [Heliobacterium chlorum]|uniref:Alkaline phosphatase family protein n=1 Tax=Heliobacterium chlorum TaxID=2698 RepID=A0ABR7SZE4_HELCL|nr:alkaline phosphatase family protein [Heliobacterium chlorum]
MRRKKVIMFIIDSLHPRVLDDVTHDGSAPALSFLRRKGFSHDRIVSAFPTMTPTALSSIATGTYADQHKVPGFIWFSEMSQRLVNYGATPGAIVKLGVFQSVKNLLYNLNQEHVNPLIKTCHEVLEERGYSSGNINFFIYRGRKRMEPKLPWLIRLAAWLRLKGPVFGPESLVLGECCLSPGLEGFRGPAGPFNKFGFNDTFSCLAARELIRRGRQPDFMAVYLPDNDGYSHRVGPLKSHPCVRKADQMIQQVLNAFPSWEHAIDQNSILVTGDHAQCSIGAKHSTILLERMLSRFKQLRMLSWGGIGRYDITICPNERMAIIYILRNVDTVQAEVIDTLSSDERIAQIMWREGQKYRIMQPRSRKTLSFWRSDKYEDPYGVRWDYEGDLSVVDGTIKENRIEFGEYPDAFSRIISAFESQSSTRVLLSARPGYEFYAEDAPIFPGGGSHGSLHESDSVVPAILAGAERDLSYHRIIDFFPWIMESLPATIR